MQDLLLSVIFVVGSVFSGAGSADLDYSLDIIIHCVAYSLIVYRRAAGGNYHCAVCGGERLFYEGNADASRFAREFERRSGKDVPLTVPNEVSRQRDRLLSLGGAVFRDRSQPHETVSQAAVVIAGL